MIAAARAAAIVAGPALLGMWSSRVSRCGGSRPAHLGDGASDAQIAATVHDLWELNADVIGTGDPDLILPGQRLKMPA